MLITFRRDQRGVAAIEFALVLPILVFLVFGVIEVTRFILANEKIVNAADQLANVASQQPIANYGSAGYYAQLEQTAIPILMGGYTATSKIGATYWTPDQQNPKHSTRHDVYGGGSTANLDNFDLQLGETMIAITVNSTYRPILPGLTVPTIGKILNIDPTKTYQSSAFYRVRQITNTCVAMAKIDNTVTCVHPPMVPITYTGCTSNCAPVPPPTEPQQAPPTIVNKAG